METIPVVLDAKLLRAADLAVKRQKVNLARPQPEQDLKIWEDSAVWPEL
jgi:hypothetical protein